MAEARVQLPDGLAEAVRQLGIDAASVIRSAVIESLEEAVRRAGAGRRKVTVTAVVMAGDDPAGIAESYAAVARALHVTAKRHAAGTGGGLVFIEYPLVTFEAASEAFTRCRTCGGSGTLTVPDAGGESASSQACPDPVHGSSR